MENLSVFDIFKIGIGPSSSHTMGPWKAALAFADSLKGIEFDELIIHLYGSLSKTGKGHATDLAVMLGLEGYDPKTIPTDDIHLLIKQIQSTGEITINGLTISFRPSEHIIFEPFTHQRHPNTLVFNALLKKQLVKADLFASVGGGFIEQDGGVNTDSTFPPAACPIDKGADVITHIDHYQCPISEVVLRNEATFRPLAETEAGLDQLIQTMIDCVYAGCTTAGILPGGLNVRRRAKQLCERLIGDLRYHDQASWQDAIRASSPDFNTITNWVSCFALAVNEQNASLHRVVTSPTNGAAGVIPAVMLYHYFFGENSRWADLRQFLLTAGQVGMLFKKGATISAAVGGCQAEIGVSSAMAAAGLTEVRGGSPHHCLMAAEIAMEHHLGLTCDPVRGLVQVPCIERNAMGAMKAITASNLALSGNPQDAIVLLDTVIKAMWDTSQDMNHKYKETSEGGLAFNVPVIHANC